MKTLLTICALAAGAGLYATSDSAQADHHSHYGRGYRYTSPVYTGRRSYDYGHGHHHQHQYDHGRYSSRSYHGSHGHDGGWGYSGYDSHHGHHNHGNYGYRSGFGLQTPSFGLYIR